MAQRFDNPACGANFASAARGRPRGQPTQPSIARHAGLDPPLLDTSFPPIKRRRLATVQVNLGYRCNQSCVHCHVDAGPKRREEMTTATMAQVLAFVERSGASTLDITGGAPELNAVFRPLVERARALGLKVMDRCNLTILEEPGQQDLADFLARNQVEIVASLPCYLNENVDGQRGKGVFDASIRGLRRLNALGYGAEDAAATGLTLNLVYNPGRRRAATAAVRAGGRLQA
jgi:radical SAM/Cys-rich protein